MTKEPGGHVQAGRMWPPSDVRSCARCKAYFVDDAAGHHAHRVVFGHQPQIEGSS
jgi:hypothetical protein